MTSSRPFHLEPSQLGTKEYWDKNYASDLQNYATNPSDIGTVWFSDSAAEEKILRYLQQQDLGLDARTSSFLDLGTGNGSMLFLLREGKGVEDDDYEDDPEKQEGKGEDAFLGTMVGVDYSRASVELARKIALEREMRPGRGKKGGIRFEEWDIMKNEPGDWMAGSNGNDGLAGFDVVLDKGTFDAISLSEETDEHGRRMCEFYTSRVTKLVKKGGLLLVTSCNWTEPELRGWFAGEGTQLRYEGRIQYPSFTFGGKTGQPISSICFRRET